MEEETMTYTKNDTDFSGFNIGQIQSMLNEIEQMSIEEHHNITRILQGNNVNYMENDNGIFVKLNKLPFNIIKEIHAYYLMWTT